MVIIYAIILFKGNKHFNVLRISNANINPSVPINNYNLLIILYNTNFLIVNNNYRNFSNNNSKHNFFKFHFQINCIILNRNCVIIISRIIKKIGNWTSNKNNKIIRIVDNCISANKQNWIINRINFKLIPQLISNTYLIPIILLKNISILKIKIWYRYKKQLCIRINIFVPNRHKIYVKISKRCIIVIRILYFKMNVNLLFKNNLNRKLYLN